MARNTRQEGSKGIVDISAGSTINTIGHNNIPLVDLVPLTELQLLTNLPGGRMNE